MPTPRALGARYGSQAWRINRAVTEQGGTPTEIAARIDEPRANVSAQLSWLFSRGQIQRRQNTQRGGRDRFYYYYREESQEVRLHATHASVVDEIAAFAPIADRTFGIEFECLLPGTSCDNAWVAFKDRMLAEGIDCSYRGYTHENTTYWKIVTDASINRGGMRNAENYYAYEIVSPVLRGAAGEAELAKVCDILVALGARVNATCGLHVHHGNEGFDYNRKHKLHVTYGRIERIIDAFMAPSRRGTNNMFCQSCATVAYGITRYTKVNGAMLDRRHRTIEFRQHQGTVEKSKVLPWVRFTRAMMNCVDLDALGQCDTLATVCAALQLSEADTSYFAQRTAHFATPPGLRRMQRMSRTTSEQAVQQWTQVDESAEVDNDEIVSLLNRLNT